MTRNTSGPCWVTGPGKALLASTEASEGQAEPEHQIRTVEVTRPNVGCSTASTILGFGRDRVARTLVDGMTTRRVPADIADVLAPGPNCQVKRTQGRDG